MTQKGKVENMTDRFFEQQSERKYGEHTVQIDWRIEKDEKVKDAIRFILQPSLKNNASNYSMLYPKDENGWQTLRNISGELHKLCRFNQASVTNRMAEILTYAANLRPITAFDLLCDKVDFDLTKQRCAFLQIIGFGIFETPQITPEDFFKLYEVPEETISEYERLYELNNKTESALLLSEQVKKIGGEAVFTPTVADLAAQSSILLEKVSAEIETTAWHWRKELTARQTKLIAFFQSELRKDFPDIDLRKYLRK